MIGTHALPPMLDTEQIAERYGLKDARAARAVIRDAGGRKIAGRWMVRADDLERFEHGELDTAASSDRSISAAPRPRHLGSLAPGELLR